MNLEPHSEDNNTHLKSTSNIRNCHILRQGGLGYDQVKIKYFRDEENEGY